MQHPKISIITPSYNQGKFIEETITSVLNQNYPNLEYIIVDGGSKDNTLDIIRKYESQLASWVSEKDSGQSDAINKGFKKATGDIIAWLNSDDILLPGALQKVADALTTGGYDLVNGYTVVIDENSNILTSHFTLKQKKWYAKRGIYYVNQPAMFWKRSILDKVGYLKEDFHTEMDKELLIRIFENDYKIGQLPQILAGFRLHNTSKSAGGDTAVRKWFLEDQAKLYKRYANSYGRKPSLFNKAIYGLEKLLTGIYLRGWLFTKKWKGKSVKELPFASF
jgi:glycosyltransferase involved in cell wall biosynthesis